VPATLTIIISLRLGQPDAITVLLFLSTNALLPHKCLQVKIKGPWAECSCRWEVVEGVWMEPGVRSHKDAQHRQVATGVRISKRNLFNSKVACTKITSSFALGRQRQVIMPLRPGQPGAISEILYLSNNALLLCR